MTIRVVRADKIGGHEVAALNMGHATIGWTGIGDLRQYKMKEDLDRALAQVFPYDQPKSHITSAGQLWNFARAIDVGDIVALPLKSRPAIAFGQVIGTYTHIETNPYSPQNPIPVLWIGEP